MKNEESYRYEEAMLEVLNKSFQEATKELEALKKTYGDNLKDMVSITCYGKTEEKERKEAVKFYTDCAEHSEGSERDRYTTILAGLHDNKRVIFDDFSDQFAYDKEHMPNKSGYERDMEYLNNLMDNAISQKELVEAVIGECVNLQKDGHIRIGVDALVEYEDFLKEEAKQAYLGKIYGKTILKDIEEKSDIYHRTYYRGTSYEAMTLADFIDDYGVACNLIKNGQVTSDIEKINVALYKHGIRPLEYNGSGVFHTIDDKEKMIKYSIGLYGDRDVKVVVPFSNVDDATVTIPIYMLGEFIHADDEMELQRFLYGDDERDIPAYEKEDCAGLLNFIDENYPNHKCTLSHKVVGDAYEISIRIEQKTDEERFMEELRGGATFEERAKITEKWLGDNIKFDLSRELEERDDI